MAGNIVYPMIVFLLLLTIFQFSVGCTKLPTLPVHGDIPIGTNIRSINDFDELAKSHLIKNILFVAHDSTAVELCPQSISEVNLINKKGEWSITSESLPRSINLKKLIFVALESNFEENRLAVFEGTERQNHLTAYQRIKMDFELEGISEKDGYSIRKYSPNSLRPILNLHLETKHDSLLVIFKSGKEKVYHKDDLYNHISFRNTHWSICSEILTIIWKAYPKESIYDIYPQIKNHDLLSSPPVLAILIDGLGFQMLEHSKTQNMGIYFEKLDIKPMRVTYPPRTMYALFTIGNGFHLGQSQQQKDEIFSNLDFETGYLIQGDRSIYDSKYPTILHADKNNDGFIDGEIFETSKEYLKMDFDFMFVHFKSIDYTSHRFGPYSEATMRQIRIVSDYVENMIEGWKGTLYIFSDHGQHSADMQGHHGINKIEDMVGIIYSEERI